jgi:tetratricopeptide (TPR) repeat protein
MALAAVHFYWGWDWAAAEAEAHRAISLDPDDAESHRLIAHVLSRTGRYREAIAEVERGRELDPLAPLSLFEPVFIYYLSHEYQTAVDLALDALAAQPDFWRGHWLLCLSLSALGRHDEAIEACNTAVAASRRAPPALAALGYEYALDGRQAAASQLVEELEARRDRAYVGPACIAVIQKALQLLEQARNDRDQLLVHAHGFRFFDPIRSTPRFSAFTRP